ncbi:putative opsin [Pluteus cervinus]|uniref:Opsin n=1 Tax=Pluteus cervinus TaxID=181527 RepID=A0ACD3BDX8_9AGAR|nr:putative opsin [Pluteus cervinus]
MANASAKRIANQNETTVKILRIGMFIPTLLSFLLRFIFHSSSLPPSKSSLFLYTFTFFPAFFLSNYLVKIGTTRRDPISGTLISYGEDLSQPGVTEWCFDIVYVTWACQVGSGAFGDWFWWFYMVIPLYAVFKVWTSFIGPAFGSSLFSSNSQENGSTEEGPTAGSKRQEKLRKRSERGDPRVKTQTLRR